MRTPMGRRPAGGRLTGPARAGRLVGALVLAGAVLLALPHPASGATTAPSGPYGVRLLGQTAWVQNSGSLTVRVDFAAADPATDRVQVSYFPQLINRTNFDSAASGKVRSYPTYSAVHPLAGLPHDPAGGTDVVIPVNEAPPAGGPFGEFSAAQSGVFPLQVSLVDSQGLPEGSPLTTFLVFAKGTNNPLSASVVVPVDSPLAVSRSGHLQAPAAADTARLSRLATVLNADANVPASILSDPLTLGSLQAGAAAGSTTDRNTLAALAGVPQNGLVQVLPSTYSPVSPGDLVVAGMSGEADRQLAAGTAALRSVYRVGPSDGTWVVNGPLDIATLGFLQAHHATTLIVPNGDLTAYNSPFTFASATWLQFGATRLKVIAADPQLTSDFTSADPPVLAANHLLAELAMIQTEQPSNNRGVVAMPPPGWSGSPEFIATVLAGLNGNPLVKAVTASQLFDALPNPEVTRYLADPVPAPGRSATALFNAADRILAARNDLGAVAAMLPDNTALTGLSQQLLIAEAERLDPATRSTILDAITAERNRVVGEVDLPGSTSITLTATKGQLPITILTSPNVHPRVELRLRSQKLIFRPASPPDGTCSVPTPTSETCTLSLSGQNTTLKVPVETRTSGVFQLEVELWTPDGTLQLAADHDSVRSTAVSGVGVVIIVVALLSLAIWWARDLRHGRRPRRLAPAPDSESDAGTEIPEDRAGHDLFHVAPPDLHPGGRRTG